MHIVFLKAIKQKESAIARPIEEHDDDNQEEQGADEAAEKDDDAPAPDAVGDDQAEADDSGYGPHNVEVGHHVAFTAGDFKGAGKVSACGEDGCTVADKTGREHRVHWSEVTGHNQGA